ncbi:MAG: HdeD family acid-resistance protein [Bryobacteraceae bacterium]|jgi:uncharacterized membrane protein HdeD (DUF308 family)
MDQFNLSHSAWLEDLRRNRGWILTAGCLAILLGMFAIVYTVVATLVSVIFLGALLIVAGVFEAGYALRHYHHRMHLLLYTFEALVAIVAGLLLLRSPERGAIVITLLLATYFVIVGIFRIITALALQLPNWGWTVLNGVITLALGIIVWGGWPISGLWVLGLFIGINLLFSGWAQVMLALALRGHRFEPAHAS